VVAEKGVRPRVDVEFDPADLLRELEGLVVQAGIEVLERSVAIVDLPFRGRSSFQIV
jgi:hypothetical protein